MFLYLSLHFAREVDAPSPTSTIHPHPLDTPCIPLTLGLNGLIGWYVEARITTLLLPYSVLCLICVTIFNANLKACLKLCYELYLLYVVCLSSWVASGEIYLTLSCVLTTT